MSDAGISVMRRGVMSVDDFLSKLRMGDVILVNKSGFDFGSLPIRVANCWKRGYGERLWTHAALYVGNGDVVEAYPQQIYKRSLRDTYLTSGQYRLMALRRKGMTAEEIERACEFCAAQTSDKYNFCGLVYFAVYALIPYQLHPFLDLPWIEKLFTVQNSYFCSELVAAGLQNAGEGVYCFEEEPARVMPVDFKNRLLFEEVGSFVPGKLPGLWAAVKRMTGRFLSIVFYAIMLPIGICISLLDMLLLLLPFALIWLAAWGLWRMRI